MDYKGLQHCFILCMMWSLFKCTASNYTCPQDSPKYSGLNATKGSFLTPRYAKPYPDNKTHIWRIAMATDLRIQLYIFLDELQEQTNQNDCRDFLEIIDSVDNGRVNSSVKTCARQGVTAFLSKSGNVSIKFTSDCSMGYKRFKVVFSVFKQICPEGWLYFDSSCYKVFHSKITWSKAHKACWEMNGDLVSISNVDEQQLVPGMTLSVVKKHYWIGLSDIKKEGEFQWSDGSLVCYDNWKNKEPNDAHGREDCVEIGSRDPKWNDDDCQKEYGYICKTSRAGSRLNTASGWIATGFLYAAIFLTLN